MLGPVVTRILDELCDTPAGPSRVGTLLRAWAALPGAANYYGGNGWLNESTVQGSFYRYLQQGAAPAHLVLQEQLYQDPMAGRADILVVDTGDGDRLGIEVKATFDQASTTDDIDKLATLLDNDDLDRAVALFVAPSAPSFPGWLNALRVYSQNTTGGVVRVGGLSR